MLKSPLTSVLNELSTFVHPKREKQTSPESPLFSGFDFERLGYIFCNAWLKNSYDYSIGL